MNNTLIKGLALLEMLAHSDRALGVTEVSAKTGLGKSNAHRLLQGLVEAGYVRQDLLSGDYTTTIKAWELGSAVMAKIGLKQMAEPFMGSLLNRFRETVHLSVLEGDEVVYIHKLDSPEPVRAYSQVGGRAPA
jgi:DNA-binding IclR family transcriptional regulator